MRSRQVVRRWPSSSSEATIARQPFADLVDERRAEPHHATDLCFVQAEGPFVDYRRVVVDDGTTTTETTTYRLDAGWFGVLFRLPLRRWAMTRDGRMSSPWWAPPDRLSARQVRILALLAVASISATFSNTVFTQTASFAADSFGVDSGGQSLGGVIVRLGVVIAVPLAALADRRGRRIVVIAAAWFAPLVGALGALAPTFWILVATQSVARPIGLLLALLIAVVAAEEMPRNSRAYAISVIALAGGLGGGIAVGSLKLADFGANGWRLVYVVGAAFVAVAITVQRRLPETVRFTTARSRHGDTDEPVVDAVGVAGTHGQDDEQRRTNRRRFAAVAAVGFIGNIYVAPVSFFQNRYLDHVRGLSGGQIAVFTLATATPASIGLVLGGRLADRFGRRALLASLLPASAALLTLSYAVGGPLMWISALAGGILAAAAYPAYAVYRTELFSTTARGATNGWLTASALAGGSLGLVLVGWALNRGWSYSSAILVVAAFELVAALLAFATYPETAHLTLEQINPGDPPVEDVNRPD